MCFLSYVESAKKRHKSGKGLSEQGLKERIAATDQSTSDAVYATVKPIIVCNYHTLLKIQFFKKKALAFKVLLIWYGNMRARKQHNTEYWVPPSAWSAFSSLCALSAYNHHQDMAWVFSSLRSYANNPGRIRCPCSRCSWYGSKKHLATARKPTPPIATRWVQQHSWNASKRHCQGWTSDSGLFGHACPHSWEGSRLYNAPFVRDPLSPFKGVWLYSVRNA